MGIRLMTEKKQLQDEQMVKSWAKKNPKYRKYMGNIAMLTTLYAKHNKASKISECIVGQEAKLTLFVTKHIGKSTTRICTECNRGPSDEETAKCGVSDFEERKRYTYLAGDESDEISINFPPWYEGDQDLETENTYVVEGKIQEWDKKLQINPESVTMVEAEEVDLETELKELLEMHKFKVSSKVMDKAMDSFAKEDVEEAMGKLGVVMNDDGVYTLDA